jgi:hypothetical protein
VKNMKGEAGENFICWECKGKLKSGGLPVKFVRLQIIYSLFIEINSSGRCRSVT